MFFIFRQQYSFWSKLAFGIINNANSQEPSKWPSANQKTASNDERNKKIQKYLGPLVSWLGLLAIITMMIEWAAHHQQARHRKSISQILA